MNVEFYLEVIRAVGFKYAAIHIHIYIICIYYYSRYYNFHGQN